jgi:leader peptidase (prepilin peptidase)/N-methyltransferase
VEGRKNKVKKLRYGLLGIGLLAAAIQDGRTQTISVKGLKFFGILGIILTIAEMILSGTTDAGLFSLSGVLPGIFLYGVEKATRGGLGEGDVWVFGISGIYLGLIENLLLLWETIFFMALAGSLILIGKKGNRKTRLPMVPFQFAAYVFLLCTGG